MSFAGFVGRHARTIIVVAVALAAAGGFAGLSLPVGLFPQAAFPRVVVDLDAGSRPADQTALLVTRPVEQAIRTVPGALDVRSETTRGSAQISVDFGWGRDLTASTLLVDAAIAQVLPSLPAGTGYGVRRMDPTVFPIISYALLPPVAGATAAASPVALRDLAQYQIQPLLAAIPGLARVDVQGGETAEVEVLADPHRLASYGLGMAELAAAITAGNVLQAVGRMEDRDKLYLVLADRSLTRAQDVAGTVVRADPSGIVRVRDVASVQEGVVPQYLRVVEDGRPAVLFNVYEQPDGNAVQIAGAVRDRLAGFALPPGVKLVNWYDQSELVTQSANSVRDAVLIGLVLAGAVLLAFLRSWRVTLIAVLVVPATLATSVLLLSVLGMSFNIMTLGGMAAAVGLIIDDAIVMTEHIVRRVGEALGIVRHGEPASDADTVRRATDEFLQPLIGSSAGDARYRVRCRSPSSQRRDRRILQGAVHHDGQAALFLSLICSRRSACRCWCTRFRRCPRQPDRSRQPVGFGLAGVGRIATRCGMGRVTPTTLARWLLAVTAGAGARLVRPTAFTQVQARVSCRSDRRGRFRARLSTASRAPALSRDRAVEVRAGRCSSIARHAGRRQDYLAAAPAPASAAA